MPLIQVVVQDVNNKREIIRFIRLRSNILVELVRIRSLNVGIMS